MVNPTYTAESTVQSRTSVPKLVRLVHLDLRVAMIDSGILTSIPVVWEMASEC
jgi:hypothetical protein